MGRKATVLGSSGLIGNALLNYLLADDYYSEVHVIVRRSLENFHPKLRQHIIDFQNQDAYREAISGSETVFCAIGTTMKKVEGNHDDYRKVDHDIPVMAASVAADEGVFNFILVSSVGANASNNNNFYLKLKGIVEESVSRKNIPQVQIFRPSLLLGDRKEKRFGERMAQVLAPVYSIFMLGTARDFKPVEATVVAKAMLAAAKQQTRGIFIHTYNSILKLAGK